MAGDWGHQLRWSHSSVWWDWVATGSGTGLMQMAGLCLWTCLAFVCPSVMWAGGGMYLGQEGEGLSLGSGELLGTWMVVPGSEQRTWEKETPLVAVETQPRQEGYLLGISR